MIKLKQILIVCCLGGIFCVGGAKSAGTIECEKQAWELAEMAAKLDGKDVKNTSDKNMESIKKKIENACSSYEGGASEKEVTKWIMEGGMK